MHQMYVDAPDTFYPCLCISHAPRIGNSRVTPVWLGDVVVGRRTHDWQIVGLISGRCIVGQRPWASCSHQCASVHQAV